MISSAAGTYATSYQYDAYGNVSRITYPGGGYETFTYLPNGNLASSVDRSGVTTTYTYNALGSPITVTAGTGENTNTISYTYAKTGSLLSESNGTMSIAYTYDALGRVATETANGVTTAYTYDLNSNITAVTIGNRVVSYTYDRLNRMKTAAEGNITTTYTYDSLGNRTTSLTRVQGIIAAQTNYTYNLAHLVTSMTNKNRAGTILSSFAYTYRADGNILTEVDHTGATTTYGYDMLGRLVSEVGNSGSRFYTYDTAGNRTQVIIDTATTISYNYNSDGSLASETSSNGSVSETTAYAYDLNGNLTAKTKGVSVTNYAYDVWGNMTSGAGATYAYNAQGLRVAKTVNGETDNFTLVGGNVWADGTTNYLRGIELISNGTQLYLYNVRGDVIQLADLSGNVTKTYDYDAYGNEYARDLGDENPFRYCGEYYDVETGFIYLRARYYDPMVGRFTTVDPIKDGLNWYSYCDNNPVNRIDPTGEAWFFAPNLLPKFKVVNREDINRFAKSIANLYMKSVNNSFYADKIDKDAIITRYEKNLQMIFTDRLINNQATVSYYNYGGTTLDENGCGVIAMYNYMFRTGNIVSMPDMIKLFEEQGATLGKNAEYGTNPYSLPRAFDELGVEYSSVSLEDLSEAGSYIIAYWNEVDIRKGMHFVLVESDGLGKYTSYNNDGLDYRDPVEYASSYVIGYRLGVDR